MKGSTDRPRSRPTQHGREEGQHMTYKVEKTEAEWREDIAELLLY